MDRAVDRAALGVDAMCALRCLSLLGKEPQMVGDVDTAHDKHAVLLLDLADRG
jgi:hypothetical protein